MLAVLLEGLATKAPAWRRSTKRSLHGLVNITQWNEHDRQNDLLRADRGYLLVRCLLESQMDTMEKLGVGLALV